MRTLATSLLTLLLLPAAAYAQDFEAAAKHFASAQEEFGKKHYKMAATEFQAAYEITKDPILLYNVGEAWQKAGDGKKAVGSYRAYLKAQPAAPDKVEVQKRVKLIEGKQYKLASQSEPGDDPALLAKAEPPRPVEAVKPVAPAGPVAPVKPVEPPAPVKPAEALIPPPSFDEKPPAPATVSDKPMALEPEKPGPKPAIIGDDNLPASSMRIGAWVCVAGTVAVLTAGAIFGLAAQSRADELTRRFTFVDPTGQPKKFDATAKNDFVNLRDEGNLYNGLAIGFYTGAAALAVVTTVLFVVDYKRAAKPLARLSPKLTPTVGKDGGGLAAAWSF
jgi:hypothetical protein